MARRTGLGSGLDNLIPDRPIEKKKNEAREEANVSRETLIPLSEIEPNREQPRTVFDEDSLNELADSIKQFGVIEPIVLQKKGKRYEIVAGERRFRAAMIAGLKEIPATVREFVPENLFTIALLENVQRQDLTPIEEAQAYQRIIDELGIKQDEVAKRVSKSRTAITNCMRLLKLHPEVQTMINGRLISEGHGRALLGLSSKEQQLTYALKIVEEKLSVRQVEDMVKTYNDKLNQKEQPVKEKKTKPALTPDFKKAEDKLRLTLGTKVELKRKTDNTGSIEIQYSSIDELDRILEILDK